MQSWKSLVFLLPLLYLKSCVSTGYTRNPSKLTCCSQWKTRSGRQTKLDFLEKVSDSGAATSQCQTAFELDLNSIFITLWCTPNIHAEHKFTMPNNGIVTSSWTSVLLITRETLGSETVCKAEKYKTLEVADIIIRTCRINLKWEANIIMMWMKMNTLTQPHLRGPHVHNARAVGSAFICLCGRINLLWCFWKS